ncbi:unnamed protein product [Onchocerca ochengi]|uniref:Uncharacterized protein n=1 Tax=Onchocerca ochengi TaxID=42157 RepID=A0A182EY43_ONCOC|nr:unnamed protein product [Onchocerca ochengi]
MAQMRIELHAIRLEDGRLRAHRSCSTASDLFRSEQNENVRMRMAERRQRKTADQCQTKTVLSVIMRLQLFYIPFPDGQHKFPKMYSINDSKDKLKHAAEFVST